jgi:hypothetical protein
MSSARQVSVEELPSHPPEPTAAAGRAEGEKGERGDSSVNRERLEATDASQFPLRYQIVGTLTMIKHSLVRSTVMSSSTFTKTFVSPAGYPSGQTQSR